MKGYSNRSNRVFWNKKENKKLNKKYINT
jgi:hypothetical protein